MEILDELAGALEHRAHARGVQARGRQAERRILPGVLTSDFGHREIELVAHAADDRPHHAALRLERLGSLDVQLDDAGADDHSSVAGFSSSTYVSTTSPTLTSL